MKTDRMVLYQESIGLLTKLPVGLSKKIRLIPWHFRERDFWIVQTGAILVTGLHAVTEILGACPSNRSVVLIN